MRVLIPIHSFLPTSRFGAELYTYYLARELQASGIATHVLFTEPGIVTTTTSSFDGFHVTVVPRSRQTGPTRLDRSSATVEATFRELLRSFHPDVVHFNHLLHLSSCLPQIAKQSGATVVFTLHDYWLRCPKVKLFDRWGNRCQSATPFRCASCVRHRYSWMSWEAGTYEQARPDSRAKRAAKELLFQVAERPAATWRIRQRERELRATIPFVDRFIAPSRFLAARMEEWGIPNDQLIYCDYGTMELPYVPSIRQKGSSPLQFGYLGATSTEKGLQVLLEAFRGLQDADLHIYGPTAEALRARYPLLQDVIAQPNVQPHGSIDDGRKIRLLPDLDALIVPSIWYENSPVVIHEAFQAGVPVICSDIGGMAELVRDGIDGAHFAVGDARDLRATLSRFVQSPERLAGLAEGVRRPTGMHKHVADEIIPIYDSLVAHPAPVTNVHDGRNL